MADRFPLILDTTNGNKIKELPIGDNLNLRDASIKNVQNIESIGTINAARIQIGGTDLLSNNSLGDFTFTNSVLSTSGELELKPDTGGIVLYPNNDIIWIKPGAKLTFEGPTPDDFETKLQATDPTADRDVFLPDEDGTIATREWVTAQDFGSGSGGSFSGDYDDLVNKPTSLSEFTNDSGFITAAQVAANEADTLDTITDRGAVTTNTITVGGINSDSVSLSSVGISNISSSNNLTLSAPNRIELKNGLMRLPTMTQSQRNTFIPTHGDVVFNTTEDVAEIYDQNDTWKALTNAFTISQFINTLGYIDGGNSKIVFNEDYQTIDGGTSSTTFTQGITGGEA